MKKLGWVAAVIALLLAGTAGAGERKSGAPPAPPAAAPSTLLTIYRIPGVLDNGQPGGDGSATVFLCSNLSSASETLEIKVFGNDGHAVADQQATVPSLSTVTYSTHGVNSLAQSGVLNTGGVVQGEATIFSTTTHMFCSSMIVDASAYVPSGIALHEVRYNPLPGTEE